MPRRYVALLRGVNNVGTTRVAMTDLRRVFERLEFLDVGTVLNSGNVVFSVATKPDHDVPARIERALASILRLRSRVSVLSAADVARALRDNPLADVATNPSYLLFLVAPARSDLARLKPLLDKRWAPEALAVGRRVAYLWCANGVGRSSLWPAADRALDRSGTARTIATMQKVMAAMEARNAGR